MTFKSSRRRRRRLATIKSNNKNSKVIQQANNLHQFHHRMDGKTIFTASFMNCLLLAAAYCERNCEQILRANTRKTEFLFFNRLDAADALNLKSKFRKMPTKYSRLFDEKNEMFSLSF